jgi:tetratricopeptide (TPR) repeat protein
MIARNNGSEQVSVSPEAIRLCEEGTEDLNAFRWPQAIDKLGQSLELDPTLAEASIARAFAYARVGMYEDFKVEAARADSLVAVIEDDQRRMLAQLRLSGIGSSQFHDMRDSLLIVLEAEIPNNIYVLETKAGNAGMDGDSAQVEQAWLRILEVDPNYASAYNNLGYMELYRGNYDKAIEHMQRYAFLAPDLANPHDSLGEVLMVMGRYEEAEAEFRTSVKMQPDFYPSLVNLGKTYVARGQLRTGIKILNKVHDQLASSELHMKVDGDIIKTYRLAGLDDEWDKMATLFIQRYPDAENSAAYRGIKLANSGRMEEAQTLIDSCLAAWRSNEDYEKYPEAKSSVNSASHQFAALLADLQGDYATAAEQWGKGVELMSEKTPFHDQWYARYRWAEALHKSGRSKDGLKVIDPMLSANPRLINHLILKVQCHLELKQVDHAKKALQQLEWSIAKADEDFPARAKAEELALKVSALAYGE